MEGEKFNKENCKDGTTLLCKIKMKKSKFKIYSYFCQLQWENCFTITDKNDIILEEINTLDGIFNILKRLRKRK